jgi:hypothetical protein
MQKCVFKTALSRGITAQLLQELKSDMILYITHNVIIPLSTVAHRKILVEILFQVDGAMILLS